VSEVFCSVRRPNDAPSGPIVFFGRLDRSKGADVLLQALARIESAARSCVIIGRGEQSDALHRIADELGIRSSVMIKDWMVPADLARVLGRASMAVLPSREESFGNAIAEAMATGAPVISTTAGSVPELITNGENGLLVPPDDPIALAAAIQKLQHDPVYAAAMGENARRIILERFTWSRVARTFEGIYNELSQA
jgi:glycosyltransferase involved in cell wall biosynthesis